MLPRTRLALVAVVLVAAEAAGREYRQVDMSGVVNQHYQSYYRGAEGLPEGNVILGGVPFHIKPDDSNSWSGQAAGGANPRSAEITVGVYGATEVHTLINTLWGQVGPLASLEFIGAGGSFLHKDLVGDDDIRDWLYGNWTNHINGITTVQVWAGLTAYSAGMQCRLDKQRIVLPASFLTDTLQTIRISDWGDADLQRAFLVAASVLGPVPGDTDNDDDVDYVDLGLLATHYGCTQRGWTQGDFTGDGLVDYVDLGLLATNYDYGTGPPAAVPEPAVLTMLVACGAALALARRARTRR